MPDIRKTTIVHVIDSLTTGGAEILLKNTVSLLNDFHHVIIFLYPNETLRPEFEKEVEFFCVYHGGWTSIPRTVQKIKKIISWKKPSLVHSHLFVSNVCARMATPKKIPLFNTLHSVYSIDAFKKNRLSIWLERLTLKRYHTLVAVSKYVLDDYLRFIPFKGKAFVLYNFLPHDFFKKIDHVSVKSNCRCIAVGTLKEAKNYDYLLKIFSFLKDAPISLDIFGDGHLRNQLQNTVDTAAIAVSLRGNVRDVKRLFADYDLFIQLSEHEGFGLSVIEAIGSGLPVVLSDIPVFKEITGGYAHFIPLGDSIAAAKCLRDLSNDIDLRMKFVQPAFDRCRKLFNEVKYVDNLRSTYNKTI